LLRCQESRVDPSNSIDPSNLKLEQGKRKGVVEMRKLLTQSFLLIVLCVSIRADEADETVNKWLWNVRRPETLTEVPLQDRPKFIAALKKHDRSGDMKQELSRMYLIELGDVETAQKVVGELFAGDDNARAILERVAQPW
jgi:hypothetical protein